MQPVMSLKFLVSSAPHEGYSYTLHLSVATISDMQSSQLIIQVTSPSSQCEVSRREMAALCNEEPGLKR